MWYTFQPLCQSCDGANVDSIASSKGALEDLCNGEENPDVKERLFLMVEGDGMMLAHVAKELRLSVTAVQLSQQSHTFLAVGDVW